jgi:hypothetical protein
MAALAAPAVTAPGRTGTGSRYAGRGGPLGNSPDGPRTGTVPPLRPGTGASTAGGRMDGGRMIRVGGGAIRPPFGGMTGVACAGEPGLAHPFAGCPLGPPPTGGPG